MHFALRLPPPAPISVHVEATVVEGYWCSFRCAQASKMGCCGSKKKAIFEDSKLMIGASFFITMMHMILMSVLRQYCMNFYGKV